MSARRTGIEDSSDWLSKLIEAVARKPLVVFRFTEEEWGALNETWRGPETFTIARSYELLRNVRVPTACILISREWGFGDEVMRFGLLESKSSITTLESRLRISHAQPISPSNESGLRKLPTDNALRAVLRRHLKQKAAVTLLSQC